MDPFEEMARKYIDGVGGLLDMYKHEMAIPLCEPPEVEGARWVLICLTNPDNWEDLKALVHQADLRGAIPPVDKIAVCPVCNPAPEAKP